MSEAAAAGNTSTGGAGTGTSTGGAGGGTGAPAAGATTHDVNPGAWMAGFNDDQKGYATNKGWKNPAELMESYRNSEKLIGAPQERVMKLPEKFYDDKGAFTPEGRAIFERLGAPKDPKDYGFKAGEGQDAAMVENFGKWAQEAGLSKPQAEKILNSFNETQKTAIEAMKKQMKTKFTDQENKLKTEWGAALDQNTNIAKQAASKLGMTAEQVTAIANQLGHADTMKLFHKLGKAVGELPFVSGQGEGNRPLEPASASAKIKELSQDKGFGAKLLAGDSETKATWQRLHEQAYPGMVGLNP